MAVIDFTKFSEKQLKAMNALAQTDNKSEAARLAGVSKPTIYNCLDNEDFVAALNAIKSSPQLMVRVGNDFEEYTQILEQSAKVNFADFFNKGSRIPKPPSEWPKRAQLAMAGGGSYSYKVTEDIDPESGNVIKRTVSGSLRLPSRKENMDRVFKIRGFLDFQELIGAYDDAIPVGENTALQPGQEIIE